MRTLRLALASAATIATASVAVPAAAQVTIDPGTSFAIPANNDFQALLAALSPSLTHYTTVGTTASLPLDSIITFHFLGSESGFSDTFSTPGGSPMLSFTEVDPPHVENNFAAPILIGSSFFTAGSLIGDLLFTSAGGLPATIGQDGFGIFLTAAQAASGDPFNTGTFYFGYDDQPNPQDDNHDDMIIRAVVIPVPEPATWGMMLLGFGAVGLAFRRRRRQQPLLQIA